MKKRFIALILSLVMLLGLLPMQALAESDGTIKVSTIAELQAAVKTPNVKTILLTKDLDADSENVSYSRSNDYTTVFYSIGSGITLNGQGHTIYNLKATLMVYNSGTVKNLNTTIHDTPEDSSHLLYHMTAQYSGASIDVNGICVWNKGTVENCNTRLTIKGDREDVEAEINGIAKINDGTIKDCIAYFDVDYNVKNVNAWLTGAISMAGIAQHARGTIDHCLVLGSLVGSGNSYSSRAAGFANLEASAVSCINSACALDKLSLICNDEYSFAPVFYGETSVAKNCRAAMEMTYTNISKEDSINEGGTISGGDGYTLAAKNYILRDWDLTKIPPENAADAVDPDAIPDDYIPIYTLADLKKCHDGYYLLMNDIDASQEDVAYDGNGYNAYTVAGRLFSGGVLNGNGHTIYNLRGTLFEYNMGTIKNLNVSIKNTDKDSDTFAPGGYGSSLAGIALSNINGGSEGLIENCAVTMTVDRTFGSLTNSISVNGISSGGVIRNCIANLNINISALSTSSGATVYVGGISGGGTYSMVDHCLVLGGVKIGTSGRVSFGGISHDSAINSACALQKLEVVTTSSRDDPYEYFTLSCAKNSSVLTNIHNRVAEDMNAKYIYNLKSVLSGKPGTQAEYYTLDTRANILADWDLSCIPGDAPEPSPTPTPTPSQEPYTDPFPEGDVWFSYSATDGSVKKHSFHYDSDYFNKNGMLQMQLAVASLCLEMASFSDNYNLAWDSEQGGATPARAKNILELYDKLGFTNAQCVNYDKPLSDTSDKVAFSMAMKYIDNGKGGTDTLVAVPIRGGGYGGEWASNFNVALSWESSEYTRHIGFDSAALSSKARVQEYIDSLDIKGDVKIWLVGYSRGAAVANLLAHHLAENTTPGGTTIERKNLYAYTFATPAGVSENYADDSDSNIFNFVSPVDVVPMVAPSYWGYSRYGQTIQLTPDFSHEAMERFRLLSGLTDTDKQLYIDSEQQFELMSLTYWLCQAVPDSGNYYNSGLQNALTIKVGELLGTDPTDKAQDEAELSDLKALKTVIKQSIKIVKATVDPVSVIVKEGIKWSVDDFVKDKLDSVARAHYPELYLTWLEMSSNKQLEEFEKAMEKKQLIIPSTSVNVRFWETSSGSAAGSYSGGVCQSGAVEVVKTNYGIIATMPAGKNYSFSVSGAGAQDLSFTLLSYDQYSFDDAAMSQQFEGLPLSGGESYTVSVSEDPYADCTVEDQDGNIYTPDGPVPSMNFTDVPEGAYFYDAVKWAVEEGITSGTAETTFSPYGSCTRAQVVTFLWRAAGCPEPETSVNPFRDVSKNAYYYNAVLWASESGITAGTTGTTFSPNTPVTRAQTVTFLWRWEGFPESDSSGGFADVPTNAYYADAVAWAVNCGITYGTSAKKFSPHQICNRAQIVTFLYRDFFGDWE